MFFLLLTLLLFPCGALFAGDQRRQNERTARALNPFRSNTTREQMKAALDESQTSFRSQQRHQQDLPVQYDVQQAWDGARRQAVIKSAFDSAATDINAYEPEIAALSERLLLQQQHRNCPNT